METHRVASFPEWTAYVDCLMDMFLCKKWSSEFATFQLQKMMLWWSTQVHNYFAFSLEMQTGKFVNLHRAVVRTGKSNPVPSLS
jgi:hypothetical protein